MPSNSEFGSEKSRQCWVVIAAKGAEQSPQLKLSRLLFDLHKDPAQENPLPDPDVDPAVKRAMTEHLVRLMRENDAPPEQFERLGLE